MRTLILAGLLAAGPALAQVPHVHADAAWARVTAPGQALGAAYARLKAGEHFPLALRFARAAPVTALAEPIGAHGP